MLKHGNNVEVMKTWFSMNCQTKKHFFQEFEYSLSPDFLHTVALLRL